MYNSIKVKKKMNEIRIYVSLYIYLVTFVSTEFDYCTPLSFYTVNNWLFTNGYLRTTVNSIQNWIHRM